MLFKVNHEINTEHITPKSIFERYKSYEINKQTQEISYIWSDPIKIEDKMVCREQKSVSFWIFKNENIACTFGNSESSIWYGVKRFSRQYATFSKIDFYGVFKKMLFNKKEWFAELVSLYLISSDGMHNNQSIKRAANTLPVDELIKYIMEDKVSSLTFRWVEKDIYFYLDTNSVISFYDSAKKEEIFDTIKKVVDVIESHHL